MIENKHSALKTRSVVFFGKKFRKDHRRFDAESQGPLAGVRSEQICVDKLRVDHYPTVPTDRYTPKE